MSAPRAIDDVLADAGLLAGRLLLVLIFLHEGFSLIGNYAGAAAYMQKSGVPSVLLPAVIVLQLGGGFLIAAGTMTRFAALLFAAFCVLTALLFHWQFANHNELLHFQKDLAMSGGFLVLACCGAGNWSLDRYLARVKRG
jgi:putative oxidoreductase